MHQCCVSASSSERALTHQQLYSTVPPNRCMHTASSFSRTMHFTRGPALFIKPQGLQQLRPRKPLFNAGSYRSPELHQASKADDVRKHTTDNYSMLVYTNPCIKPHRRAAAASARHAATLCCLTHCPRIASDHRMPSMAASTRHASIICWLIQGPIHHATEAGSS